MSTIFKITMLEKITAYFNKVKSNIQPLVYDIDVELTPNSIKTYDLKSIMADHALYDLRSTRVQILVFDAEVDSPLVNTYVNSEAIASVGINSLGIVTVINSDVKTNQFIIRIDKPTVKL